MKAKLLLLAGAASIAWGLKRHYADARVEELWWILAPTSHLAGAITGATFEMRPGEGYFSRERLFLIEKSCAGVNFLVAAISMLALARLDRVTTTASAVRVFVMSLAAGYAAAIVINATRIAIAMWLAAHPFSPHTISAADAHRIEGIIVYFGGLLLLHDLVQRFERRTALLPLGAYYFVALALPLANGAASGAGFARHALIVLIIPAAMIGALMALRALRFNARP